MSSETNKFLGLKVPDNYDVRYRTYYADLYDINTKSYLGTCKIMDGVTVDYTRWQDLNNTPDLDIYVGEKIVPAGNFKFTVEKANLVQSGEFTLTLNISGEGLLIVNWGPDQETTTHTLTGEALTVSNVYASGKEYQVEIFGELVKDVSISPQSTAKVSKVLDFGEIGLESLQMSPPDDKVTYTEIPLKLAPTIKSLDGFCKGMQNITTSTFGQWDFTNVVTMINFARGATASEIDLSNKQFDSLLNMSYAFAELSASSVTLQGTKYPVLQNADMLFFSNIHTEVNVQNVTFPEMVSTQYWIAGADHINLQLTQVEFPKLTTTNSLFGEANDHRITINGLKTPLLKMANRTFSSLGSVDPNAVKSLTITDWDMSAIESMTMTFSGWVDAQLNVSFATLNLSHVDQLFSACDSVTVIAPELVLKSGGNISKVINECTGTCNFDFTHWRLGANSTVTELFTTWSDPSNSITVDASNLTIGAGSVVDGLAKQVTNGHFKANVVTIGDNVDLESALSYFYTGSKLTALQWTVGNDVNLTGLLQYHEDCELLASNWTLGDACNLNNFSSHCSGPTNRTLTDFTIGKGGLVDTIESLFSYTTDGKIRVHNWTWGVNTSLVNLASNCTNAILEITSQHFSSETILTDSFYGCDQVTLKVGGWTFNSVSLIGQFSNLKGSIEGLNTWVTTGLNSLERLFAHSTIYSGIDGIESWDTVNVLSCSEAFLNFNPDQDFPNIASWNFASVESFNKFAAYSGPIRYDIGHLQVGSATNMDMMFTGQTEVITNQDLSCWNVEKIPSEPTGWGQQGAEGNNRLPLWGVPMSDMSQRYHSSCRLDTTPDPLPPIDNPIEFTVAANDTASATSVSLTIESEGTTEVHWGDDDVSRFANGGTVTHTYSDSGPRLVKVLGLKVTKVVTNDGNSHVSEIGSFGEIGLKGLDLTPSDGSAVKYRKFPATIPSTLVDLTEFARGYVGDGSNPFSGWDFSTVTTLKGFLLNASNVNLSFTGTSLGNVVTLEDFMLSAISSSLTITNANLNNLNNVNYLAAGSNRVSITLSNVSAANLTAVGAWIPSATKATVNISGLELPSVQNIDGWLSQGMEVSITVDGLTTPSVTAAGNVFGKLTTPDSAIRNTLTFANWTSDNLANVGALFAESTNTDMVLGLEQTFNHANVSLMEGMFHSVSNCTVDMQNVNIPANLEVGNLMNDAMGSHFTFHGWSVKDGVTFSSIYNTGRSGNTIVANDMTIGNDFSLVSPVGDLTESIVRWGSTTIGTNANLSSAFANVRGILELNNWQLGANANLTELFNQAGGAELSAKNWTLGNDVQLDRAFTRVLESTNGNDFSGWTLAANTSGSLEIDSLLGNLTDTTVTLNDWIFQGDVLLTSLTANSTNSTLNLDRWTFDGNAALPEAVKSTNAVKFNVRDWKFNSNVSLNATFTTANNIVMQGLASWTIEGMLTNLRNAFKDFTGLGHRGIASLDTVNVTDYYGAFAGCTPLEDLDFVNDLKLDSALDASYMFYGSGKITVDIGHWQVGNLTLADNMFSASSLQDFQQNLTCWKVRDIPVRPQGWATLVDTGAVIEPLWGQADDDMYGRTHDFCAIVPEVIPFPTNVDSADGPLVKIEVLAPIGIDMEDDAFPLLWFDQPEEDLWRAANNPEKLLSAITEPYTDVSDLFETSAAISESTYPNRTLPNGVSVPTGIQLDFRGNILEPFNAIVLSASSTGDAAPSSFFVDAFIEGSWVRVLTKEGMSAVDWRDWDSEVGFDTDTGLVTGATKLRLCLTGHVANGDNFLLRGFRAFYSEYGYGPRTIPFPTDVDSVDTPLLKITPIAPIATDDSGNLLWLDAPEEDLWIAARNPEMSVATTEVPVPTPVTYICVMSSIETKQIYQDGRGFSGPTSFPSGLILDFKGNTLEPFDTVLLASNNSASLGIKTFYIEAEVGGVWTRILTVDDMPVANWKGLNEQVGFPTDVGLVSGATKLRICITDNHWSNDRIGFRSFETVNSQNNA